MNRETISNTAQNLATWQKARPSCENYECTPSCAKAGNGLTNAWRDDEGYGCIDVAASAAIGERSPRCKTAASKASEKGPA